MPSDRYFEDLEYRCRYHGPVAMADVVVPCPRQPRGISRFSKRLDQIVPFHAAGLLHTLDPAGRFPSQNRIVMAHFFSMKLLEARPPEQLIGRRSYARNYL